MSKKITQEIFENILKQIETSSVGIGHILKKNDPVIGHETFCRFLREGTEENRDKYAQSKLRQADYIAEECIDIADNGTNDFMTIVKGDKEYSVENREVTNRSRLRVDTRKWLLSKLVPKKYGEKIAVEHSGDIDLSSALDAARKRIESEVSEPEPGVIFKSCV